MNWYIQEEDGAVLANLSFENGVWSQEGIGPYAWELLTYGVVLDNGQEVNPSDGVAFIQGIRRVYEPSGAKVLEGTKPLSPAKEFPESSEDALFSET